jgi:hypothetical protein
MFDETCLPVLPEHGEVSEEYKNAGVKRAVKDGIPAVCQAGEASMRRQLMSHLICA